MQTLIKINVFVSLLILGNTAFSYNIIDSTKSYFESPKKVDIKAMGGSVVGDFNHSVVIDLKINPHFRPLRNSVSLQYSALSPINTGFGVGWSLVLPHIDEVFEKGRKKKFLIDENGKVELLERNGQFVEKFPKSFVKVFKKGNGFIGSLVSISQGL